MPEPGSAQGTELNLYRGEPQHENFCRMGDLFPTRTMAASREPFHFRKGAPIELPQSYEFSGNRRSVEDLLATTDTSALLVLKDGEVRLERYWLTGGRDVQWISWSVAKSFVSALVGIAIHDGVIESIAEPISNYAPSLAGSVYDGVRIKDVLQMSSGARWNEDYSDAASDIHRLGAAMAGNQSLAEFVMGMERATPPGTFCQYNSADTQALGMLVVEATGRHFADYMQEKLCEPLGMESAGCWLLDSSGMEMVLGGLNLTARDFAKIGELFRNGGAWGGKQIVPKAWVEASIKSDAPHLEQGKVVVGGHGFPAGYGYQWWVPAGDRGEFSAIGVYNQFVFVDSSRDVVIVKLSANRTYGSSPDEATNREAETIEFLRAAAGATD